ncbi:MAG: DUF1287 domain-containing protein [Bacillota bacterium]
MLRIRSNSIRVTALVLLAVLTLAGAAVWAVWRSARVPNFRPPLEVEVTLSGVDADGNGTDDCLDIVAAARAQVEARPIYRSEYYQGGYPPDNEGVCTDLIWRAFEAVGYAWKDAIDRDIAAYVEEYPRIRGESPDPNIDFRRVPNLHSYLSRHAEALAIEAIPWDKDNLKEWQPGDLVIFGPGNNHIGIVSDKRRRDGLPLVIHHGWGTPVEDHVLEYWGRQITSHFRVDFSKLPR